MICLNRFYAFLALCVTPFTPLDKVLGESLTPSEYSRLSSIWDLPRIILTRILTMNCDSKYGLEVMLANQELSDTYCKPIDIHEKDEPKHGIQD